MTARRPVGAFWLFAYGSLMWNPDFPVAAARPARLYGYHRALCIKSWTYRGTKAKPGIVFGLDRGGACTGMALQVDAGNADAVFDKVMAREMVSDVYRPVWTGCRLGGGRAETVEALAFVADRTNPQYAGRPDDATILKLIRQGRGAGGPCVDYVLNTHAHLAELGIRDRRLERIVRLLDS